MTESTEKKSVLFVCMGNICRSPTAEGVFRHYVQQAGLDDHFHIDSAGTHAYHIGEPPDRRAVAAAEKRGISLVGIVSRRVAEDDFADFDLIIAMDEDNQRRLLDEAPDEARDKVQLLLSYAAIDEVEVPDPYYGGAAGFERVLDLVELGAVGLLQSLATT